uniref:Uncharacterized protein n=1 Tax=Romanomermis culicivorax TaxID=13658 RepID=A0A915J7A5_ROMCU
MRQKSPIGPRIIFKTNARPTPRSRADQARRESP